MRSRTGRMIALTFPLPNQTLTTAAIASIAGTTRATSTAIRNINHPSLNQLDLEGKYTRANVNLILAGGPPVMSGSGAVDFLLTSWVFVNWAIKNCILRR